MRELNKKPVRSSVSTCDNAVLKFIEVEADSSAKLLRKLYSGDWKVTADFDKTVGKVTFHPKFHGTMAVIEFDIIADAPFRE